LRFLTHLFINRCFYWTDASNGLFGCYEFSRAGSTFKARKKGPATQLDTTTIAEAHRSLSLRGTSGERAGERGSFHGIGAANWNPLSLTLSPLLRRGERGASRRTNVLSEHVSGNGYAKSTSSPDSVRAGLAGGGET